MPGFAKRIPRSGSGSARPFETIDDLAAAAEARVLDGVELATCAQAKPTGAIYLLGYSAEMVLKVALYRAICGARLAPNHDLNSSLPGIAKPSVRAVAVRRVNPGGGSNFHDLNLIYDALVAERSLSSPIAPAVKGALDYYVPLLAENWAEWIRYRPEAALDPDLCETFMAVDYLLDQRPNL